MVFAYNRAKFNILCAIPAVLDILYLPMMFCFVGDDKGYYCPHTAHDFCPFMLRHLHCFFIWQDFAGHSNIQNKNSCYLAIKTLPREEVFDLEICVFASI